MLDHRCMCGAWCLHATVETCYVQKPCSIMLACFMPKYLGWVVSDYFLEQMKSRQRTFQPPERLDYSTAHIPDGTIQLSQLQWT